MGLLIKKTFTLYHSTTVPLSGSIKIKGKNGFGFYLSPNKKYSQTFGDITYKVTVQPNNLLIFYDNEVKGKGFFNMTKQQFDNYINKNIDSLAWVRKNKLTEFVVLKSEIVKNFYNV